MTEQIGEGHDFDHILSGIPHVSPEIVAAFRAEPHKFDELFDKLKQTNRSLADFLLARAVELTPGNLQDRERVTQLALEALGIITSQAQAEELNALFNQGDGIEPQPPVAA